MKYYSFYLSLFLFLGCATLQPSNHFAKAQKDPGFQGVITSIYAVHSDALGILVHVEAPDSGISWGGAVGFSDRKTKQKLQINQPALIASNTKTFVSVAILRLIEEGKLGLYAPIENLLTEKTKTLLQEDQYDLKAIKVVHLMSHTSGIQDYVDDDYMAGLTTDKTHRWTRDEQIARAVKVGNRIDRPGQTFSYADMNYLLLTEIIEQKTNQPFYLAIRSLLNYRKHRLNGIWFETLEKQPRGTLPLAHQYAVQKGWNSYEIDPSFDLYGGGGIAATPKDLARFSQLLFNKKIIKDPETLNLIYTDIGATGNKREPYFLGLSEYEVQGMKAYGHGGFWGTMVQYIPDLNASVTVYIMNRDAKNLRKVVMEAIVKELEGRAQKEIR